MSEDAAENSYQKKNHNNNNNNCSQSISIVRIQNESEIDNQPCLPPDTTEDDLESACTEAKIAAFEPETGFVSPEKDDKQCRNGETLGVLDAKHYKVG